MFAGAAYKILRSQNMANSVATSTKFFHNWLIMYEGIKQYAPPKFNYTINLSDHNILVFHSLYIAGRHFAIFHTRSSTQLCPEYRYVVGCCICVTIPL